MRNFRRLLASLALVLFILPAFAQKEKKVKFMRGAGMFEITCYEPLADKPLNLWYYIPTSGNIKKMPVLFSMHGAERSGRTQRGVWRNLAEEYGFIVLCPEFLHANGYPENGYQFGGVAVERMGKEMQPEELWSYKWIESIFDFFKEATGNVSETYDMFGHSAGGQWTHRYLIATPGARCRRAVAANPGNYTYPYLDGLQMPDGTPCNISAWPFSVKGTPFADDDHLRAFFKRDLTILIGSEDTEPQNDPEKEPANSYCYVQGWTRYERAFRFWEACKKVAEEKGMEFNIKVKVVPGAWHNSGRMVYGQGEVGNWRIEDDERVYNVKAVTSYGAYSIIFEQ